MHTQSAPLVTRRLRDTAAAARAYLADNTTLAVPDSAHAEPDPSTPGVWLVTLTVPVDGHTHVLVWLPGYHSTGDFETVTLS